ncbi:hypothetical protein BKA65DRAFT_480737 [Rhexocercosporidium sp. MPI-PUGE-AT-0058]|nr:hypothetical protein BKA65DRAFT_480737 [Rhexocercosporidium sp. MPI-PUGE-AT-0058]
MTSQPPNNPNVNVMLPAAPIRAHQIPRRPLPSPTLRTPLPDAKVPIAITLRPEAPVFVPKNLTINTQSPPRGDSISVRWTTRRDICAWLKMSEISDDFSSREAVNAISKWPEGGKRSEPWNFELMILQRVARGFKDSTRQGAPGESAPYTGKVISLEVPDVASFQFVSRGVTRIAKASLDNFPRLSESSSPRSFFLEIRSRRSLAWDLVKSRSTKLPTALENRDRELSTTSRIPARKAEVPEERSARTSIAPLELELELHNHIPERSLTIVNSSNTGEEKKREKFQPCRTQPYESNTLSTMPPNISPSFMLNAFIDDSTPVNAPTSNTSIDYYTHPL